MRCILVFILSIGLLSCERLEREPISSDVTFYVGKVAAATRVDATKQESRGKRVALSALSLNSLVMVVGSTATEKDFGDDKVWKYELQLASGRPAVIFSYNVLSIGDCVRIRQSNISDDAALFLAAENLCAAINPIEQQN